MMTADDTAPGPALAQDDPSEFPEFWDRLDPNTQVVFYFAMKRAVAAKSKSSRTRALNDLRRWCEGNRAFFIE